MKNIIKYIFLGVYIIFVFLLGIYFFNFINVGKGNNNYNENDYTNSVVEQGGELATGINSKDIAESLDNNVSEDESLYSIYLNSGNYASFSPASQNKMEGDYATKTEMMNKYLADNTFYFDFPENAKKGYLYVRLNKSSSDGIFLFWYGSDKNGYKVSGDLDLSKNLIINSDTEFLFDLSDIPYTRYYDKKLDSYDRLNDLRQGKSNYIAGFLRVYDGSNKIDKITIARE